MKCCLSLLEAFDNRRHGFSMMTAAGRHLHHHQMHHRQGQATLSVLPETMEGAEIATASQLSGVSPGPPPAQSSRRPARHSSARTGPLLPHSHHRAHLREQAAQLNDQMHRKSVVSCPSTSAQHCCCRLHHFICAGHGFTHDVQQ